MDYCTGPSFASGGFIADSQFDGGPSSTGRSSSGSSATARSAAGPTASGTRSSPASWARPAQCFPARRRAAARTRRSRPARSPARRRSSTSTARALQRLRPGGAARTPAGPLGLGPDAGPLGPDRGLLRRQAGATGERRSTARSPGARTCIFTPGVYHDRQDDQGQARRRGRARARLRDARCRGTANVAMTVADVPGVDDLRAHLRRRAGQLAGAAPGRHRRTRHRADMPKPPTRPRCRTCSSGSAAPHAGKATASLEVNSDNVDPRRHLGLARRPRQRRRLDREHRRHRRHRQRRRRHGVRAVRRALPEASRSGTATTATVVFFQNEMPYDPPSQAAWMAAPGVDGYPASQGRRRVTSFSGSGMGSYSFFNQGVDIFAAQRVRGADDAARVQPARPADDLPRPDQRQGRHPQRRQRHGRVVDDRQPGRAGDGGRATPEPGRRPGQTAYAIVSGQLGGGEQARADEKPHALRRLDGEAAPRPRTTSTVRCVCFQSHTARLTSRSPRAPREPSTTRSARWTSASLVRKSPTGKRMGELPSRRRRTGGTAGARAGR